MKTFKSCTKMTNRNEVKKKKAQRIFKSATRHLHAIINVVANYLTGMLTLSGMALIALLQSSESMQTIQQVCEEQQKVYSVADNLLFVIIAITEIQDVLRVQFENPYASVSPRITRLATMALCTAFLHIYGKQCATPYTSINIPVLAGCTLAILIIRHIINVCVEYE